MTTFLSSQPVRAAAINGQSKAECCQHSLTGFVNQLPQMNDLLEKNGLLEESGYSQPVYSQQFLPRYGDSQLKGDCCEQPPADLANGLSMLDDLFEDDTVFEETCFPIPTSTMAVPCSMKKFHNSTNWDDDEAYFSYSALSEESGWLAGGDPAFVRAFVFPQAES
jgi:hypothetical protein